MIINIQYTACYNIFPPARYGDRERTDCNVISNNIINNNNIFVWECGRIGWKQNFLKKILLHSTRVSVCVCSGARTICYWVPGSRTIVGHRKPRPEWFRKNVLIPDEK